MSTTLDSYYYNSHEYGCSESRDMNIRVLLCISKRVTSILLILVISVRKNVENVFVDAIIQ